MVCPSSYTIHNVGEIFFLPIPSSVSKIGHEYYEFISTFYFFLNIFFLYK